MLFQKWVTAIGIFVVMFLGAWWINEESERVDYIHDAEQINHLRIQEVGYDVILNESFKPREYIKIR